MPLYTELIVDLKSVFVQNPSSPVGNWVKSNVFWQKPLSAAPLSYRKPIAPIERISAAHLDHVIQRWWRQCPQQQGSEWELSGLKLQKFVNMNMDNLDFNSYNIVIKYCSLYFTCLI